MEQNMKDMPVLALRGLTIFPNMLMHFDVEREISIRALERATEPFYREESGGRMGLGLHICRLLCERHGGSFSICNNAEGGAVACASFAMHA